MNPKKKNVLMICCDHWFADLMGCAGRHDIMTPTRRTVRQLLQRVSRLHPGAPHHDDRPAACHPRRSRLL